MTAVQGEQFDFTFFFNAITGRQQEISQQRTEAVDAFK
jgi:hypothetical protein